MKTLSYTLCAVLAAGFAFTGDAQVKPKSKKVTELKFSGRIQGQWDGIESDGTKKKIGITFISDASFWVAMPKWGTTGVVISSWTSLHLLTKVVMEN